MENIYKIKIRSNLDPRELYPSERRYSSSIVLGFSVLFLALAFTSSLMGVLVVKKIAMNTTTIENRTNHERLFNRVEQDVADWQTIESHPLNKPAIVSSACFVMSLGLTLAGITGILAWKQWYIDHNITWFFLASGFSTITSAIGLLLISLCLLETTEFNYKHESGVTLGLIANIMIIAILGLIWSSVASKVAYKGMKSNYPDDIVLSKGGGRIEVSTVIKGNKNGKVVPPDILNHFPTNGKIAKYFTKKDSGGNLPKQESNKEYQERVNRFLAGGEDQPNSDYGGK